MRNRIKFWSDREIRAAFDKRGGKYKGILQQLIMERDYAYQRQMCIRDRCLQVSKLDPISKSVRLPWFDIEV